MRQTDELEQKSVITSETGEISARETLEFYTLFNEERVVVPHFFMIIFIKSVLDVATYVVEAPCTYIAGCSFQHVNTCFHLGTVFLIDTLSHLVHALIKRHNF